MTTRVPTHHQNQNLSYTRDACVHVSDIWEVYAIHVSGVCRFPIDFQPRRANTFAKVKQANGKSVFIFVWRYRKQGSVKYFQPQWH